MQRLFPSRSGHRTPSRRRNRVASRLGIDTLERRRLLAVTPGVVVQTASWTDADGDLVSVDLTGSKTVGAGFTVELAGFATDNADATRITLSGLTSTDGLQIRVTPVVATPQPGGSSPGTTFAQMYTPGYTNITFLSADSATPLTAVGAIQLSAAIVHSISLADTAIGSITLDPGQAPNIDRINTQNNQQAADSTMYNPVTGLIDMGGITAASIDSLVINGAISAPTKNPFDTSVTNDFRSVVSVSGRIGSVVGLRSSLSGAIRADSIGSVRVANIAGEITTRNSGQDLSINLPSAFKGFINSAGHLHLGFPLSDGSLITGQITAGRGISGSDKGSTSDTLYLPGGYAGSLTSTSNTIGIASVDVDGEALFSLVSTGTGGVGDVSADSFAGTFTIESQGNIGSIVASDGEFEGHLLAVGNIGGISARRGILGTVLAFGDIGPLQSTAGAIQSPSIQAGGDIESIGAYAGILGTSFVAGRDIGDIAIATGGIGLGYFRGRSIGDVAVRDGGIATSSFIARAVAGIGGDIGDVSAFGSITGFGISDVSMVADGDIGVVTGETHTGNGIEALKLEAEGEIAGVVGFSAGEFGELAGAGIIDSNFVAGSIGGVSGRGVGGTGIETTRITTRTATEADGPLAGSIGPVIGRGWNDGLRTVTVVAHRDIASITGISLKDGNGIFGGSFDANYGAIGPIVGQGGANGGAGIASTRFQATDLEAGGIAGITATSNANGLDAMVDAMVYASGIATAIGPISATVHGGLDGNGIVGGEIRAFAGGIASIAVDVRSINGIGILDGKINASGSIGPMTVKAFNNAAISGGTFQTRGNFGAITATAEKGGNAIENATFTAPGRIFYDDPSDPGLDRDPLGNFGSITAIANGTSALSNAIASSTFTAIGEIGAITARSKGGAGITDSFFTADSDGDYVTPVSPGSLSLAGDGTDKGRIASITVVAAGRNLLASSGIVASTFRAAGIGPISVDVQTVEGGDGIVNSTFTAVTAEYDGVGNFDNRGTIGSITVRNQAVQAAAGVGDGIAGTKFVAGAAGGIGNIAVTTASGSGIITSIFDASVVGIDLDQNLYTSTIGSITVTAGRVADFTLLPAGITGSTFTSAAGIGAITVNSIGSGITGSAFVANFDWSIAGNLAGPLSAITVAVPGRNASAVTGSAFLGSSIGNINVQLANNAAQGINAVALSNFTATDGAIGNILIVHSRAGTLYNAGLGYAVLTSTFTAKTAIGSITIVGRVLGAVFTVGGTPIVVAGPAPLTVTPSIGNVQITVTGPLDIQFNTSSTMGNIAFVDVAAGESVTLGVTASSLGNVSLAGDASTLFTANVVAQTMGNFVAAGSAVLNAASLTSLGDLDVAGQLSLPKWLPNLVYLGSFKAGSLAAVTQPVHIGVKNGGGILSGPVQIGQANKGRGAYDFFFSRFGTLPSGFNASVAGRSFNASLRGTLVNGVRLIGNPPPPSVPSAPTPTAPKKPKRR